MLRKISAGLFLGGMVLAVGASGHALEDVPADVSASTSTVAVSTAVPVTEEAPSPLAPAWDALARGDTRSAGRLASTYLSSQKSSPEALVLLGQVALAEGDTGGARKRFRQALKQDGRYASAYYGLGQVYEKKGRLDEAANEYHAALLADPRHSEAVAALARLKDQSSLPE